MSEPKIAAVDPLGTAYHEAGHAIIYVMNGLELEYVTIEPDSDSLGHVQVRRPEWLHVGPTTESQRQLLWLEAENTILGLYAGGIAEAKYASRKIDWGHEEDAKKALELAISFIGDWEDVYNAFLDYCHKHARRLVELWWPEIQAVACSLAERKTLTGDQVHEAIDSIPMKKIR
jgi:ATP-dependent Zn protease